jgi:CubicO group peptidase (beta-lactamase class C family)
MNTSCRLRKLRLEVLEPRLVLSGDPVVFDPDEASWDSVLNLTAGEFAEDFSTRQADSILIDIEVNEVNSGQLFSGVWQQNVDGRLWASHFQMTSSQFSNKLTLYGQLGYRLIDQEIYSVAGQQYHAASWIENSEGYTWASSQQLTGSEFSDRMDQYKGDHILIDVEATTVGNAIQYADAWVENTENFRWTLSRDRTVAQFAHDFNRYQGLYRIHDIESYQVDGEQRYAAIWIQNSNGRAWESMWDMDTQDYVNQSRRLRDLGYRLTDVERYETTDGTRYAGAWRQNTDRPDWYLRSTVDAIADAHATEHNIPGLSVAIVYQDEIRYMRGFGHQNIASDVWYSAHTINRLASVSKAVGGVLLLKLGEQGEIDPSAATSTYVAEMPAHHTHTLAQLTSNRGGVGHYSELGLGTLYTQYDTAVAASELFWDESLLSIPGTIYDYSTHGYTLLGAGIEGATGEAIDDVLFSELGSGLGLPTLKAEDRSVANEYRTTLYNTNNTEATPDNISWKILGGGVEASAYDLVRFSSMLMGGEILSGEGLEQLWTVPPPTSVSYALGWSVSTLQGEFSIRKDGSQLGANTYVRLFPELELGIVVLANRRNSEPGVLSIDIANAILPELPRSYGDFNLDNNVDAADYTVYGDTFGSTTDLRADADGNGIIGPADYSLWQQNFGLNLLSMSLATTSQGDGLQVVPEVDLALQQTAERPRMATLFTPAGDLRLAAVTASLVGLDREPVGAQPSGGDPLLVVDAAFAQSSAAFTEDESHFIGGKDRVGWHPNSVAVADFAEDALASGLEHIPE